MFLQSVETRRLSIQSTQADVTYCQKKKKTEKRSVLEGPPDDDNLSCISHMRYLGILNVYYQERRRAVY